MSFSHFTIVTEEYDVPSPHCFTSVDICALRFVRTDSTGAFEFGAEAMYEMVEVLQLGVSQEVQEGARTTLENGCGGICFNRKKPNRILGQALALELCHLDAELLEMMTGGTVLTSGGVTVGFQPPATDAASVYGALEVWTKAWDGDEQATDGGDPLYIRWAYPLTSWTIGNYTLQGDVLRVPLTGDVAPSSNFGDGPLNDWPSAVSEPGSFYFDTTIPAGQCGYAALAGS